MPHKTATPEGTWHFLHNFRHIFPASSPVTGKLKRLLHLPKILSLPLPHPPRPVCRFLSLSRVDPAQLKDHRVRVTILLFVWLPCGGLKAVTETSRVNDSPPSCLCPDVWVAASTADKTGAGERVATISRKDFCPVRNGQVPRWLQVNAPDCSNHTANSAICAQGFFFLLSNDTSWCLNGRRPTAARCFLSFLHYRRGKRKKKKLVYMAGTGAIC